MPPPMKVALFTGKGGVGKTTLAAATGYAAARRGLRTLLLSTDAAHSLSDVLQIPLTGTPSAVPGSPDGLLHAAEVEVRAEFENAWSSVRANLVGLLAARGVAEVTADEITVLPGADEIICLLQVERWAASGEYDVIVVDCAPTGETLKLLALPDTLRFYADRFFSAPARILRSLAAGLTGRAAGPGDQVRDTITELLDRLTRVRDLLTDPDRSGVRLVVTPEHMVIAEARRALTALALHGYPVSSVLINRVLPQEVTGPWADRVRQSQQIQLAEAESSFAALPIRRLETSDVEPLGGDRLEATARLLYGDDDPFTRSPAPVLRVEGAAGRYSMTIPLPLADRSGLALSRSDDDLIVTLGAHRRRIALPSLLTRCRTTGATFQDNALVITFEPDPDRWPSALAGAL